MTTTIDETALAQNGWMAPMGHRGRRTGCQLKHRRIYPLGIQETESISGASP
jgi:hypothetical protein